MGELPVVRRVADIPLWFLSSMLFVSMPQDALRGSRTFLLSAAAVASLYRQSVAGGECLFGLMHFVSATEKPKRRMSILL